MDRDLSIEDRSAKIPMMRRLIYKKQTNAASARFSGSVQIRIGGGSDNSRSLLNLMDASQVCNLTTHEWIHWMTNAMKLNPVRFSILTFTVNVILCSTVAHAQTEPDPQQDKAYARVPQKIAQQNESQWEDSRWQQTDVGPFLAGTIDTGAEQTLKGIAIRVGDRGQAAVCFDTARMRISAAWTGEFLKFGPRRFGMISPPQAAGKLSFSTKKLAGWANNGRFKPEPDEITDPEVNARKNLGNSEIHLPKEWSDYQGMFTSGQRVVLSYSVGNTKVLESPWFVEAGPHQAFVRSLEIGPSAAAMQLLVADQQSKITIIDSGYTSLDDRPGIVNIAAHDKTIAIKLLISDPTTNEPGIQALTARAGAAEELSRLIAVDAGRFQQVLTTVGETSASNDPYVIDTLTLPFENPWNALLFTAGHDFFSDGSAAICTFHGDVWTVTGIDRELNELRWRRFATGLCQPLGLKIVDDKIYVIGRNQITRLHDKNGDGEADFYENFNNDLMIAPRAHDYVTCLDTDPEGNFYFIHAQTGVMRLSADGSSLTSIADGFRNPNGMAVGPNGIITAAPQQGGWTPESSLILVKQGGYYGFGGPRISPERPTGWDLPMCFIPRSMDNSGGAQVWVEGDRWGPLAGKMLHLSFGQCRILMALIEEVDGVYQGGTIQFPTTPSDFESGIMRGRFSPHDGQLYVSGLRGWQSRAIRDGCLQRVRYTGGEVHLPTAVKTYQNGIKLTFTEPLDPLFASNPDNFSAEQWNYRYSQAYGSPDFSVINPEQQGRDRVPVESATPMDNGYSVFLEMPNRQAVNQLSIDWLLRSEAGQPFRGTFAHTINAEPQTSIPESDIVRLDTSERIDPAIEQRLRPGLEFRFTSATSNQVDSRISRLVALRQSTLDAPTPFLQNGPFSLDAMGTIRTELSGFYDFRMASSGAAQFWINDQLVIDQANSAETSQSVLLRKGHNLIRVRFDSPKTGFADLQLYWKGYDFGWEPIPADVLFHDSGSAELVQAQHRREGRQLFASSHCSACHQTEFAEPAMFELSLSPPDLSNMGDRLEGPWLQQWLLSPHSLRPQSPMPAMLGTGEQAQQDAADLAAYLLQQSSSTTKSVSEEVTLDGVTLYEQLGCMGCHHFERPTFDDEYHRLSLHFADAKYKPGALAAFLSKPQAHSPGIRMPDFRLSDAEAQALAAFIRQQAKGEIPNPAITGNAKSGKALFRERGCQQCHQIGQQPASMPTLGWNGAAISSGCLSEKLKIADVQPEELPVPDYDFTPEQRDRLRAFVSHDLGSLSRTNAVETSARLYQQLQCANCHDRDGQRSPRGMVMAEEGSGKIPEQLPQLSWAGEKLQSRWTQTLLTGELKYKTRPWLTARMPAYPAYAAVIASGLAAEHGLDPKPAAQPELDSELVKIGESLTLKTGLDCRQCHAIGDRQPQGDKETEIAVGINFTHIRDRLRRDAYHRFMLDPPRYDIKSRMIRLAEDGKTTKLKSVFDGDAQQQFEAIWQYIQSLPDTGTPDRE